MKRAPRSRQRHDLYAKYHDYDSEISDLLGECGPKSAIKSVMKRNETADEAIELARLEMALKDNIVTDWVKANGTGDVDPARLAKSIDQVGITYEFKAKPTAADIFTSEYLPPASERKM